MSALVDVLESAPPADIVDQHPTEVGSARAYIGDQLFEPFAPIDLQPAETLISVSPDDVEVVARGIGVYRSRLIFDRVSLVNGGHPHILGGALSEFSPELRQLC